MSFTTSPKLRNNFPTWFGTTLKFHNIGGRLTNAHRGSFHRAWAHEIEECRRAIRIADYTSDKSGARRYESIVDALRLTKPDLRGSGVLTAVAAVGLIWCDSSPESSLRIAANAIGTDTDTIATMAGAIMGLTAENEPPVEVLDAALFRSEAKRLAEIASGRSPRNHRYPDLLHWSPPKARADALFQLDSRDLYVTGLGIAEAMSEPMPSSLDKFKWQWVKLDTGQTLLIKRRNRLAKVTDQMRSLATSALNRKVQPVARDRPLNRRIRHRSKYVQSSVPLPSWTQSDYSSRRPIEDPDIEDMIEYLEANDFEDRVVGMAIRSVVNKCSVGQIGSFLSVIVDRLREPKHRRTRNRR